MRAEDLRLVALVLLACAAVAIAGDVMLWLLMSAPLLWVGIVAIAALFCITFALVLIASARRAERRLLDRIENL